MDNEKLLNEILETHKSNHCINEKVFKRLYPSDYAIICSLDFPNTFSFSQKLYHYAHNDISLKLGVCECGNRCSFINFVKGYNKHCSSKCSTMDSSVKEKMKTACIERYGVDNPAKAEGVKKKTMATNLERYGETNPMKCEAVKEHLKKSNNNKYGCDYGVQCDSVKDKIRNTNLERYGVENVFSSIDIQDKIRNTNLERYGVEHIGESNVIQERIKETNVERYGVDCCLKSPLIQERIKKTNVERYGCEFPLQSEIIREKAKETSSLRYAAKSPLANDEIRHKIASTNVERYGVEWFCMHKDARCYTNNSKVNSSFAEKLNANGITFEREYPIERYSYDFKVGNALLELNPTITHNSNIDIFGGNPKDCMYHLCKTRKAIENGYTCIHVWDWDDQDKILNVLKPKQTLYARHLEIREVGVNDANLFLNAYHIQNTCKGQLVRLGLYMNDILVELMTFGKPRYNKNYEWELLRLCSHCDYNVVGGAERLFKHFIGIHKPKSIISYCDNSKFSGKVYERLGFEKKSISKPTKHWYNIKTKRHVTDNFLRQRGFDQLFDTNYGKGTSNEELMLEYGFLSVYDCGQKTFAYINI